MATTATPMSDAILVVGCGSIGERHLRCLQRTGRSEVAACDNNPALLQRITGQYHVAGFADLNAALASRRFDGVVICTPAHTHLGIASKALQHGAGLLIEKPLSTGLDAVPATRDEIAKAGKFVGVAYVYHFMPW